MQPSEHSTVYRPETVILLIRPAFGFAIVWPKKRTRHSPVLVMHFQSGLSSNMFLSNELEIFCAYFLCQDTGICRLQRLTGKYPVFIKTLLMATWWSNYVTLASIYYICEVFFQCAKLHETHKGNYNYTDVRVIFQLWLLQSNPHYIIFLHLFIYSFIHSLIYSLFVLWIGVKLIQFMSLLHKYSDITRRSTDQYKKLIKAINYKTL